MLWLWLPPDLALTIMRMVDRDRYLTEDVAGGSRGPRYRLHLRYWSGSVRRTTRVVFGRDVRRIYDASYWHGRALAARQQGQCDGAATAVYPVAYTHGGLDWLTHGGVRLWPSFRNM